MSFQKKSSQKTAASNIPGTRPSVYRNQLLVSTGIPSLDRLMDGGMGVGTVFLLEDRFASYSKVMIKYFLAEGIESRHRLLLATSASDVTGQSLLKELPQPITFDPEPETDVTSRENLEIAWRYQKTPTTSPASEAKQLGHYFDLTKTMESSKIERIQPVVYDYSNKEFSVQEGMMMNPAYRDLLEKIENHIQTGGFHTSAETPDRNILRIGLCSLGSPYWNEGCLVDHECGFDHSLPRFLLSLRHLMRSAYAACMITVPTYIIQDEVFMNRIRHLCDTVVRLESFAGSDKESNPAFKDYHGLLHVVKQARLNSCYLRAPDTTDLAFKLRRKKFTIEKMHLPPDLSETVSRSQDDEPKLKAKAQKMTCSSVTGNKLLEF